VPQGPFTVIVSVDNIGQQGLSRAPPGGGRPQHANTRRVARGDLAQDLELKTNIDLTRQIHLLTVQLHRRLIDRPASDLPDHASATSDGDAPRAPGQFGEALPASKPSFEVVVIRARPHQD
jgi:hypothetical protein